MDKNFFDFLVFIYWFFKSILGLQLIRIYLIMETVSESIHLWSKVLNNLESKIDDRRIFDAFLSDSKIFSFEGNKMVVAVTSSLAATLLTNKYLDVIQSSVREITGQRVDI